MKVAVVGAYGAGLTMRTPRMPSAGETLSGGVFTSGHGGKGSNQAVAARRLGAEVSLLTIVGNDGFGRSARQLWSEEDVDVSCVRTSDSPTMAGFIIVEEDGENRIIIAPGALQDLTESDVTAFERELACADVVVVSLEIPLGVAFAALRVAHDAGTLTVVNPAPAAVIPDFVWDSIDVITPNETEIGVILGALEAEGSPSELATQLHAMARSDVVLTRGSRGAVTATSGGLSIIPPIVASRVVDTTGAGDAFTAALAVALADGCSVSEAARFASYAGAFSVAHMEVIASLAYRSDLPDYHPSHAD